MEIELNSRGLSASEIGKVEGELAGMVEYGMKLVWRDDPSEALVLRFPADRIRTIGSGGDWIEWRGAIAGSLSGRLRQRLR